MMHDLFRLADMKHWEMAPTNAGAFEKAGIPFCLTTADLRDIKTFLYQSPKGISYGLTETGAFQCAHKNTGNITWCL